MIPGMGERRTCDYVRHSLTSLSAAFNIAYEDGHLFDPPWFGFITDALIGLAATPPSKPSKPTSTPGHRMARRAQTLHLD